MVGGTPAPHVVQDLAIGEEFTRVAHKQCQEAELSGREPYHPAFHLDRAPFEVYLQLFVLI